MHKYRCVSCDAEFTSTTFAHSCPSCKGKILIHLEGEAPRKKSCPSGSCSSCNGCGR